MSHLRSLFVAGLKELKLALSDAQVEQCLAYQQLLAKWNAVYNLTAIRKPEDMVRQHLLDSLAAAPAFAAAQRILDVGAGGGLPGMMLAIAYPDKQVSMIDTVSKKTAFLNQARIELELKNVHVQTGRVEVWQVDTPFDTITSRAFSELANFVNWSQHLLADGGRYIALKGQKPNTEIEALPAGWQVSDIQNLQVPGLQAERHLVFIERSKK